MSHFTLLRLPQLAQLNVLQQAKVIDLVTFSFCSRKAKKLVKLANVQLYKLKFYLYSPKFKIYVNGTFSVRYSFDRGISKVYLRGGENVTLFALLEPLDSPPAVASLVIGHMVDTFRRVENTSVHSDPDNLLTHPVWNYRTTINNLKIIPNSMETANEEVMNFIFNTLTVTGRLEIRHTVAVGYQYSNGFQQEEVSIYHANWVHFNAVLHSRSSYIWLLYEVPFLPATQFQTFLKLWMNKTHMDNLKYLRMRMENEDFSDSFCQQIVDGIEHERVNSIKIKVRRIDEKAAEVDMFLHYFMFRVID